MVFNTLVTILVIISGTISQISALFPEEIEGALRGIEDAALAARKTLQVSCLILNHSRAFRRESGAQLVARTPTDFVQELTNGGPGSSPVIFEGLTTVRRKRRDLLSQFLGAPQNEIEKREETSDAVQADSGRNKKKKKKSKKKEKKSKKKRKHSKKKKSG